MKCRLVLIACLGVQICSGQNTLHPSADEARKYVYQTPSADGTGKWYMGREIAQIMGPGGIEWLDRPERSSEEQTQAVLDHLPLSPQAVVADIGAGSGYYTFKIARLLPHGKIYAVEIQEEMIRRLRQRITNTAAKNVTVVRGDTLSVHLPFNSIDLAFMVDVYHELSCPREVTRSIFNSLKPNGKLALIEYRAEDPTVAIKPLHKTSVKQLTKEMKAAGFRLDQQGEFLPLQHFLVFAKINHSVSEKH